MTPPAGLGRGAVRFLQPSGQRPACDPAAGRGGYPVRDRTGRQGPVTDGGHRGCPVGRLDRRRSRRAGGASTRPGSGGDAWVPECLWVPDAGLLSGDSGRSVHGLSMSLRGSWHPDGAAYRDGRTSPGREAWATSPRRRGPPTCTASGLWRPRPSMASAPRTPPSNTAPSTPRSARPRPTSCTWSSQAGHCRPPRIRTYSFERVLLHGLAEIPGRQYPPAGHGYCRP